MGAVYLEEDTIDGPLLNFDGFGGWGPHIWITTHDGGVNNVYVNVVYSATSFVAITDTTHLHKNTWYILAVTYDYDNSLMSMWVDGELMTTGPIPANLGTPNCEDTVYMGTW